MMQLLYFNKIETNKSWGAENFLNQAFLENGINAVCLDYEKHRYQIGNVIRQKKDAFDAVLVQRGVGYNFPINILKSIKRPKILLFTELIKRNENQHYLLRSDAFDHIYVRSEACYRQMIEQGWQPKEKLSIMLSAAMEVENLSAQLEKNIDVLFVGALTDRRKKILAKLNQHISVTHLNVFGSDFYKMIQRSKIILNLHGSDYLDTETRIFEALACGGFVITETLAGESPFQSGIHLVESKTINGLIENIQYYLDLGKLRNEIATAGHNLVLDEHTYSHRAIEIKNRLESLCQYSESSNSGIDRMKMQMAAYQEKALSWKDSSYQQAVKYYHQLKKLSTS